MVAILASRAFSTLSAVRLCYNTKGLDMEQVPEPFNDHEKRYMLAEILKRSTIPTQQLFAIVRDYVSNVPWTDIALPRGRTVTECRAAYNELSNNPEPRPHHAHPQLTPISHPVQEIPSRKRPYPPDVAPPGTRPLQPRPPLPLQPGEYGSQYGMSSLGEPAQKKKRGRPTKAEAEKKAREAAERGEAYPPQGRRKQHRPSMTGSSEGAPGTPIAGPSSAAPPGRAATPQHQAMEIEETSSGKRRRMRPQRLELDGPSMQPPESPLQSGSGRLDSGRAIYLRHTPVSGEPSPATDRRDTRMEGVEDNYPPPPPYPSRHHQFQHQQPQPQHHPQQQHQHQHPPPPLPPPQQAQQPQQLTQPPPPPPPTSRSYKETVGI